MFDYLQAKAYHKLRGEIMILIEAHSKEYKEHDNYQSGKLHAFADVLDRMIAVDAELQKEIDREDEKLDAYYEAERSADNSSHEQQ